MQQNTQRMRYRLGLDLGTNSLGWAMLRLDSESRPCAVIKAGVRIFSDGRVPKTGESLAVVRRLARQQRRTRDRKIRRRNHLIADLVELGFFPAGEDERKALERLDPYALRARGLDAQLNPGEFARAVFHLAQRRGFKSNRKTDSRDSEASIMKTAIAKTRELLTSENCRTIGEWLAKRLQRGEGARARVSEITKPVAGGKERKVKVYDLYLDRSMVHDEFCALWKSQARFNLALFNDEAFARIEHTIFFQRDLRPVLPGRCTLIPEEPRAPLALPSQQRFRIYQEVNNLRKLDENLNATELTLSERNIIADALAKKAKLSFAKIKSLIKYDGDFNLEDEKRTELKGNTTAASLSRKELLGSAWFGYSAEMQDKIVKMLLNTESEEELIKWLEDHLGVTEETAQRLSDTTLASGYGSLSEKALQRILPVLTAKVITYDKAVLEAGFDSHSALSHLQQTGELLPELPYYGEYLQRHVGFGTGVPEDPPEKRFGKVTNPTVHIALNQTRVVVNSLIHRYGRPAEIIIEVARDLKLSRERKREIEAEQAKNQKRNERIRSEIAAFLGCSEELVNGSDIKKWILWEELGGNALERLCPYSGRQISATMLLSDEVEIEHILPFARTLDDSMANKTVAIREANRIKGNRTPWEAREDFEKQGWPVEQMLARADRMPKAKRMRFGENGYADWLRDNKDFVARALTDTQYMSVLAREYLSLVCPNTQSIPGRLTAMLRAKFGFNFILGDDGEKNRNDHRHHAVDACVIAVTDRSLLHRVSTASAQARERGLNKLLEAMPLPWAGYRESVRKVVESIKVSHKPDHGYQGAMHDQTALRMSDDGFGLKRKEKNESQHREYEKISVVPIASEKATKRHGLKPDGTPKPYKGYRGNGNFCMEIVLNEKTGKWEGDPITTYEAYQIVRQSGENALYGKESRSGKPLVMRLMINDTVEMTIDGKRDIFLVNGVSITGNITLSEIHEANVSNRARAKTFNYTFKRAGTLQKAKARLVTVTPAGRVRYL